jgi:hypothetical protein
LSAREHDLVVPAAFSEFDQPASRIGFDPFDRTVRAEGLDTIPDGGFCFFKRIVSGIDGNSQLVAGLLRPPNSRFEGLDPVIRVFDAEEEAHVYCDDRHI